MSKVPTSRRTLVATLAGATIAGAASIDLLRSVVNATAQPGLGRTLSVDPSATVHAGSDDVDFVETGDPTGSRGQVAYVTSRGTATNDYAFSLVDVRKQRLTVAEVESLTYDFYVGPGNSVGDRPGEGSDEVDMGRADGRPVGHTKDSSRPGSALIAFTAIRTDR